MIKILNSRYNRNGVSGRGFHKVLFNYIDDYDNSTETLIAIVPENDEGKKEVSDCSILNPLRFEDCYRGDVIGFELIPLLEKMLETKLD